MYYLSDAERALLGALWADLRRAANQPARRDPETTRKQDLAGLQADALAGLILAYDDKVETAETSVRKTPETEQLFSIVLDDCGDRKIQVIKDVRAIVPGLGLKAAKDIVDKTSPKYRGRPTILMDDVKEEKASWAIGLLELAGATAHYERTSATPEEIQAAREGILRVYHELNACSTCGNKGKVRNPTEIRAGMHINTCSYIPCPDCRA